jgi:hypothetical protein
MTQMQLLHHSLVNPSALLQPYHLLLSNFIILQVFWDLELNQLNHYLYIPKMQLLMHHH